MLQKKRIQKAFSRCASRYENNAQLQKEIAQQLVVRLLTQPLCPPLPKVLEVGVGTGYLAQQLGLQLPLVPVFGCDLAFPMLAVAKQKKLTNFYPAVADAEYLPYQNNSFELVISSLTYQWVNQLEQAFSETHRILKKGGQLYLATLGPASLQELRESFGRAHLTVKGNWPNYLQEFPAPSQLETFLQQAGFEHIAVNSQLWHKVYPSPKHLLRTLQEIGATNASKERPQGLASRKVLAQMEQIYCQNYSHPEGISATYEIIWVQAYKAKG